MTNTRRAIIRTDKADTVARYLPSNYRVVSSDPVEGTLIEGEDNAGWTLHDYVLPRLASGLYFGEEVRS